MDGPISSQADNGIAFEFSWFCSYGDSISVELGVSIVPARHIAVM
jgi:hypothetical protein